MGEPTPEGAQDGAYQVGECHGGPLNGHDAMARYPKGFLLVDKAGNKVWIYEWNGTAFVCREPEGETLDYDKRLEAADSLEWDVRAYAGGGAA